MCLRPATPHWKAMSIMQLRLEQKVLDKEIRCWNTIPFYSTQAGGIMNPKLTLLASICVVLLACGCATIMHGTSQEISISSVPSGAEVIVNGQTHGLTPVVADLKRKDQHLIQIQLDGYQPFEIRLVRRTSGWVWGNIVFGGLIGLAVDAITGGLYKISPDEVRAELSKSGQTMFLEDEALLVVLKRPVSSEMELIGQLEPM